MSNIYFSFGTLYQNLRKAAVKKLESSNAKHVIFGVRRNERGQLSTFFKVFADDRSFFDCAYKEMVDDFYIYAVHA